MPLDEESESTFELLAERLKLRSFQAPLSRFAYKSTTPQPQFRPGPSRPTSVPRKDLPVDLPDAQLVQLTRCVACRLQWTSKKSPKQKRTHVEQCAKKNALTKDTIRSLVEQEIGDARENEATLMDSVVPGPSKKARRQEVVPTVRSPPETRGNILDRAKDILGPINAQPELHLTQQFGQSALACRNAKHPALLDVNLSTDEPPLTQPFGASALHQKTIASRHTERSSLHGASMFAQDAVSSNKRPASPSLDSDARPMRQRIQ